MTDTPTPVSAEAPAPDVKECLTPDIVERLRRENCMPPYYGPPKLQEEAAAEITRLRASERSAWNAAVARDEKVEALTAENERLTAALTADNQTLRLAMGEVTAQDMRNIRAAFGWVLSHAALKEPAHED